MTKSIETYFCDACGKEVVSKNLFHYIYISHMPTTERAEDSCKQELCEDCFAVFSNLLNNQMTLKDVIDFYK